MSNFRAHYYDKVGFVGVVDERKTLECLLAEDPKSAAKCANFALKCASVPTECRLALWKIVLNIAAKHDKNAAYVSSWRKRILEQILTSLKLIGGSLHESQLKTLAYLVATKRLVDRDKQLSEPMAQNFMAISEAVRLMFNEADDCDRFWISVKTADLFQAKMDYATMIAHYHRMFSAADCALYSHMEKIGLNQDVPLKRWFGRGLAGVLHPSALVRLWDRVIGGGGAVLVFVYAAVALVEASRVSLLSCQTSGEAIRCLASKASSEEETDEGIVLKALERWTSDGQSADLRPRALSRTLK